MISLIRKNFLVIKDNFLGILVITIIGLCSLAFGIYMTNNEKTVATIAYYGDSIELEKNEYIKVDVVDSLPDYSLLVRHKYDAIVVNKDSNVSVQTLKNDDFKNMIELGITQHKFSIPSNLVPTPSVAKNIVGFSLMFLIMQSLIYYFIFGNDIEKKLIGRINTSPISISKYLLSLYIYSLVIYIPPLIMLSIMSLCKVNIGIPIYSYVFIFFLVSLFSGAFSTLLFSLCKKADNASILGSLISVLTCILSGSFYSTDIHQKLLKDISYALPQKHLLDYTSNMQFSVENFWNVAYIIIFSVLIYIACILIYKKRFNRQ